MLSLIKVGSCVWEEDLKKEGTNSDLERIVSEVSKVELNDVTLSLQSLKLCTQIGGYIVKSHVVRKKPDCATCKKCLLHANELHTEYLNLVSRRGLKVPSLELLHYTATSFGILKLIEALVRDSNVGKRYACEHIF